MTAERPAWCPDRKCRPLGRVREAACAGAPGDHGRLCFNFANVGGAVYSYDRLTQSDLAGLRDLLDALDDARIAREEGAARET